MLSALLVSLREGMEAALVVGICLLYLRKTGRPELERPVWYGVVAALLASLGGAALLEHFAWNEDSAEGVLMLVAAALLVSMILWMRRVARSLRREIEGQVNRLATRSQFAALGLFLFVFAMVLREGIETVVFLGAISFNEQGLAVLFGTLLGLGLAVALGVFFFQGMLPIRLDRFFDATSLMLIVIAAQMTLLGIHELSEAFVIPSGPWMMRLLGPIARNDVFFYVILLATAAGFVGRELLRRRHAALPAGLTAAQQRRERRWMAATAAAAFVVLVALAAEHVYARVVSADLSPAQTVFASSDTVRLPVGWVNDGALHRFRFQQNGSTISFLVIRLPDGRLATALEACTICGAHGYYQEGEMVICKNCAAEIPIAFFQTPGGCNPVPVLSRVEGHELIIPVSELLSGSHFFHAR